MVYKLTEDHKKKISLSMKGGNSTSFKKGSQIGKKTQFKKGHISLLKGKSVPNEVRKKISISKKGKLMGKDNPRYTGFIHRKYKIKALEWLAIRNLILERDLFKCQDCGKNHHENILDVHHKIPFRISQDNSLNNLITLCRSCHMKEEFLINKQLRRNKI